MNYFELFDLPVHPAVDKVALQKKYFELQKQFHPDFFTSENEFDQEASLLQSAEINKAYKTFQSRQRTIEYFLEFRGVIIPGEKYNLPPDFLMEMMELNEDIDDEGARSAIVALQSTLESEIAPILANGQPPSEQQLAVLKSYVFKEKYLKRILERLDD